MSTVVLSVGGRIEGFSLQRIVRRFHEWRRESFYGLMAFAFIGLVILPLFSLSEDRINGEYPMMNYGEIKAAADEARTLARLPVETASLEKYFDALFAIQLVEAQCRLLHLKLPYAFVDAGHPCLRFERGSFGLQNDLFNRYHTAIGQKRFAELAKAYYDLHPERRNGNAGPLPVVTVWHHEKLAEAYLNGIFLALAFSVFRIRERGLRLGWEIVSGRLLLVTVLWPGTFWFYPGDPREQAREIRRWCGYILSSLISFFGAGMKMALADVAARLAGGVGVQSSYVIDTGKTLTSGWVVQPWAEASRSGAYLGVWASAGLERSRGNEVDFTAGYRAMTDGTKFDFSYNYYRFLDSSQGMHVPKLVVCNPRLSLCGRFQYMVPDTGARPGMQFGLAWSHRWNVWNGYGIGMQLGAVHTRDTYGSAPITQLRTEISFPLRLSDGFFPKNAEAFGRLFVPLNSTREGNDKMTGLAGIRFAF
jgi:hypothetical protein